MEIEESEDRTVIAAEHLGLDVAVQDEGSHVQAGEDVVDPGPVVRAPAVHLGIPTCVCIHASQIKYCEKKCVSMSCKMELIPI